MTCYSPLKGWRSRELTEKGKRKVVFNLKQAYSDLKVDVPCGQCIGCRLEYSRQWAVRCVHEASLHDDNCFVTLTYRDDCLPSGSSLLKRDVQLFMKRLRKAYKACRIRFFCCGEYGERLQRPHYHLILFGFDFTDKVLFTVRNGVRLYRSASLELLWSHGFSTIGQVSFESASYVARYCVKKVTGRQRYAHYSGRQPEFSLMSRRPGIAREWIERFHDDVYPHDYLVIRKGVKCKPVRYYDDVYDSIDDSVMFKVRAKRKRDAVVLSKSVDATPERMRVRERVKCAKVKSLVRVLHNSDSDR